VRRGLKGLDAVHNHSAGAVSEAPSSRRTRWPELDRPMASTVLTKPSPRWDCRHPVQRQRCAAAHPPHKPPGTIPYKPIANLEQVLPTLVLQRFCYRTSTYNNLLDTPIVENRAMVFPHRYMSPREMARLQSFPDRWPAGGQFVFRRPCI
jgi:site-specific DNA-cytosine methylase